MGTKNNNFQFVAFLKYFSVKACVIHTTPILLLIKEIKHRMKDHMKLTTDTSYLQSNN